MSAGVNAGELLERARRDTAEGDFVPRPLGRQRSISLPPEGRIRPRVIERRYVEFSDGEQYRPAPSSAVPGQVSYNSGYAESGYHSTLSRNGQSESASRDMVVEGESWRSRATDSAYGSMLPRVEELQSRGGRRNMDRALSPPPAPVKRDQNLDISGEERLRALFEEENRQRGKEVVPGQRARTRRVDAPIPPLPAAQSTTRERVGVQPIIYNPPYRPPRGGTPHSEYPVTASTAVSNLYKPVPDGPKAIGAVWDLSTTRDTTTHFELDVEGDLDGQLEEFSRLMRIGHFKAADQYFQNNLLDHIDNPFIAVGYANMLLEQGAYKRLDELIQDGEITSPQLLPSSEPTAKIRNMLRANLRLIIASANMYSHGDFKQALTEAREINSPGRLGELGSTEVQILTQYLKILSYAERGSNFVNPGEISRFWRENWKAIYEHLLSEGLIWDVRDFLSALIYAFGAPAVWETIFDSEFYSAQFLDKFLGDWALEEYDESTHLAILDILVILARWITLQLRHSCAKHLISAAKICLVNAGTFAAAISQESPENIKSRQYVRWILAEECLSRQMVYIEKGQQDPNYEYLGRFPGLTVWTGILPIYVPVRTENPGWHSSYLPGKSNELLEIALNASQEIGDLRTEAMCLGELINNSEDPKDLFSQLASLQKGMMDDKVGYLETCLSKYLLLTDKRSSQLLVDELAEFDGRQSASYTVLDPLVLWCERMVQIALYRSSGRFQLERERAETLAKSLVDDLPTRMRAMIFKLNIYPSGAVDTHQGSHREAGSIEARTDAEIESPQGDWKVPLLERMVELLEEKVEMTKRDTERWRERAVKEAVKANSSNWNPTTSRGQVTSIPSSHIQSQDRNNAKPQQEKTRNSTYTDNAIARPSPKREHHVKLAEYPPTRVYHDQLLLMDRPHSSDVDTDVEHSGPPKRADTGMTDESEYPRQRDYIDGSDYSDDGQHEPDKIDEAASENEVHPSPQQNLDTWVVREKKQPENGDGNGNAKEEAVIRAENKQVEATDDWGWGSFTTSKKDKKRKKVEMSIDEVLNIKKRENPASTESK